MIRRTPKTTHFLRIIGESPGITTAELHRRAGGEYAHGHHKYTYETVSRMHLAGLIRYGVGSSGARGAGLYLTERGAQITADAALYGAL